MAGLSEGRYETTVREGLGHGTVDAADGEEHAAFTARLSLVGELILH